MKPISKPWAINWAIAIILVCFIFSDFFPGVPSNWYQPYFAFVYVVFLTLVILMTLFAGISGPSLFLLITAIIGIPVGFAEIFEHYSGTSACLTGDVPVDTLYFSYVTYMSLGYGDLSPIGECRFYAVVLGLYGMLLPPVLIASLLIHAVRQAD